MRNKSLALLIILVFLLSSCNAPAISTPLPSESATGSAPTEVPATPTPTSAPLALVVNGEGILLSEYQSELIRLQSALSQLGKEMSPAEQKDQVINSFIDQLLLAQAAARAGFSVSEDALTQRIDRLIQDLGRPETLTAWQTANGYTDDTFRIALKREMAVAWQRDVITNAAPITAEQIHARQLFFKNEANAIAAQKKLESGVDFGTLAEEQDTTLGGDLGWFPRGMLTQPEVEAAVFAMQPGETSGIIASSLGYHIVNVLEREIDHPLSTEARVMLQEKALQDWLTAEREKSSIEILVP